ncbi:hypothetical protein AB0L40_24960 [Patulibacter sp. NPDC049589]|uniref:hypothetical protein n=1 Tax=Patulibacter sp. NPDC049589 TaxID=3154731 RepID=UPI003428EEFD
MHRLADPVLRVPADPRRPLARRAVPALLAVALLATPAVADAKTLRADNVYAYGQGQVSCIAVRYGKGIECSSAAVPAKEVDGYLALRVTGKVRRGERGDFPGYSTKRRKLAVGDVWRPGHSAKGIVCTLESQGLRCRNRSGHGFVVEPQAYRRF